MMHGPAWNHRHVEASGIRVHFVRHGGGAPLVLLHGWPELARQPSGRVRLVRRHQQVQDKPHPQQSSRTAEDRDPILKVEWADRLGDYFADLDFSPMREAGHFAHFERPDLANREILEFFSDRIS